jgi:predicted ester cyclase
MRNDIVLAGTCLALGTVAGYTLALVNEHNRLARNKALVRRMHAEVWSEGNVEKAAKAARHFYIPDFVLHDWRGDDASGIDGVIRGVADEHATFSDLTERPDAFVAEGDLVVDRFITTGRQARNLDPIPHHSPGIPNRGKSLRMPEMEMFRVQNGKLAEQWLFPDVWGTHAQLGLFDPDHWTESICGVRVADGRQAK